MFNYFMDYTLFCDILRVPYTFCYLSIFNIIILCSPKKIKRQKNNYRTKNINSKQFRN